MAAGAVVAAVQAIPWSTVIEVTPRVLAGARDLLQSIRRRPAETPLLSGPAGAHAAATDSGALEQALREIEQSVSNLETGLRQAGEVIEGLARANEALVGAVARQRRWLILLSVACVAALAAALFPLIAN